MDKSSSEQQFRKREGITFAVLNFWSRTPSGTPVLRQAGWPADENPGDFRIFLKFIIDGYTNLCMTENRLIYSNRAVKKYGDKILWIT